MTSPGQIIDLALYSGILIGILFSSPVLIYELFVFIRPALTKAEYALTKKLMPVVIILFFSGSAFGIWISQFLITLYSHLSTGFNVNNIWDVQKFFSLIALMAILMGIIFQMPVILTWLIRLKIVSKRALTAKRQYVYAILLVITILMPPPDLLSDLIIFLPLAVLFEATILLNHNQE
jgi:sec-independent protein translocase protein TatC